MSQGHFVSNPGIEPAKPIVTRPFKPEDDRAVCKSCGKTNFKYVDCGAHGQRRDCQTKGCEGVFNGFASYVVVC